MTIELTEKEQQILYNIVMQQRNDIETTAYIEGDYYPKQTITFLEQIAHKLKPEWR